MNGLLICNEGFEMPEAPSNMKSILRISCLSSIGGMQCAPITLSNSSLFEMKVFCITTEAETEGSEEPHLKPLYLQI